MHTSLYTHIHIYEQFLLSLILFLSLFFSTLHYEKIIYLTKLIVYFIKLI